MVEGHHIFELTLDFDEVLIRAEQTFSDIDVYAFDYLMSNGEWSDDRVVEIYPAFCEKNLLKQIKSLESNERHFIRNFISDPFSITEIKQYFDFCKKYDKRSEFVDFCSNVKDHFDTDSINTELDKLDKRLKKSILIATLCYIVLAALAVVFCIFSLPEYIGWGIIFSMINCVATYLLSLSALTENDEKSEKYVGRAMALAVAHIILYFVACSDDYFDIEVVSQSWTDLVVGMILFGVFSSVSKKKKFGEKTDKFLLELKAKIDSL